MAKKSLKGVNEQSVLFLIFIAVFVLVMSGLFFLTPKFTGLIVLDDYLNNESCVAAGHSWENLTECTDIPDCVLCITEECETNCQECEDVVIGGECSDEIYDNEEDCELNEETWTEITEEQCTDIPDCVLCITEECETNCQECEEEWGCVSDCDAEHLDLCDETECSALGKYWYDDNSDGTSTCNSDEQCVPETCNSLDYECGEWSDGCGTTLNCGTCTSEETCTSGICVYQGDDSTTTTETESTITAEAVVTTCAPNWQCGDWSECVEGTRTRTCTDTNLCNSNEGKPVESESCAPAETCSDGIRNQDEQGIDCGGVCETRCGFFTIVGSAISVPMNSSKEFIESHKALSFSVLGGIVLVVVWIVAAKFFLKKKVFFFMDKLLKKKKTGNLFNSN